MLIAQITDTHLKLPGKLAYKRVDTAQMLRACVTELLEARSAARPDRAHRRPDRFRPAGRIRKPASDPRAAAGADPRRPRQPRRARGDARGVRGGAAIFPAHGFLQYAVERGPLRFVGLDTRGARPGRRRAVRRAAGLARRRRWPKSPTMPTLVLMHHPPFLTGIAHMDRIGLQGREGFAAVMRRHDQVKAILCGHVHRPIHRARRRPGGDDLPEPRAPGGARPAARGAERVRPGAAGLHAASLAGRPARLACGRARRLAGAFPILRFRRQSD